MSIEKRLADHMAEQSERLSFPASDPQEIINRPPSGQARIVTTLAALAVVVAAGVGFWSLSSGNETTEIAASETDQAVETDDGAEDGADGDDADGDGDGSGEGAASGGPFVDLSITDVTGDNSPGSGRVVQDDGVYYVLSTAPGRVRLDDNLSEDEWNRLFRPNTIYSLADGGWQANKVEDRFVSDFTVDDGILYALSTGTLAGDETTSYGTSTDRGASWQWQPLSDLPPVNQVAMLNNGDGTMIVASRWGSPGYEETIRTAQDAGFDVSEENLRQFDSTGFSYLPIDRSDPCSSFLLNYGLADMAQWLRQASGEEREMAQQEIEMMLADIGPELDAAGCDLDLDLATIDDLEIPEPQTVRWDEIGVTVPERWLPWSGVFHLQDGELTELTVPWSGADQVGYIERGVGELSVMTFHSTLDQNIPSETRWTSSDGESWTEQTFDYSDEAGYYGPGYQRPVAGNVALESYWVEPTEEQIAAYEEQMQAYERGDIDAMDEAMVAEFETSRLRRSIDGGPWEEIEPADLVPGIDLDGYTLSHVEGKDYGIFIFFSRIGSPLEAPEQGQLVLYSNNGTEWGSFETRGQWLELYEGDGDLLAFDNRWIQTETGGSQETDVLLLSPQN